MITRVGRLTVFLLMGAAAAFALTPDQSSSSLGTTQRAFQLTYTASVTQLPADAREIRVWIPLATTRENQRVTSRRIHAKVPYAIHQEPAFANEMAHLVLHPPIPKQLTISVDYEVLVQGGSRLTADVPAEAAEALASPEVLSLALRDEPYMVINDTVTRLAHDATNGQTSDLEKARAIYDYVLEHMRYDKTTPGWGRGDTVRACLLGKGNCTDFHSLFISMARSVGIPARFLIGAPIPHTPEGEVPGYHCWAEFYTPQAGWIPVDASEAWKHPELRETYFGTLDPNKFLISVGRNLRLVPAQAGPPVNIFIWPYVEVDGTPFGAVETQFRFRSHMTPRLTERSARKS